MPKNKKISKSKLRLSKITKAEAGKTYSFIGFDISSSTIGYSCLYIKDGYILDVDYDYLKPKKTNITTIMSLIDVQRNIEIILTRMINKSKSFNSIIMPAVEDFLLAHTKTSAQSITLLATYNTAVCLSIFNITKIDPLPIPVATIRAKLRKLSGIKTISKEDVPDVVEKIINNRSPNGWVLEQYTNKKGLILKENYDISDSIAVALAYAYEAGAIC